MHFLGSCPAGCEKSTSTVCVQNECVCALVMKDDGLCTTSKHCIIKS